ncbi:hypothetical protein MAC_00162 [Metarhizium acridum CQMa 102]|uniref:TIM-barrel domain-containing protein n=1 Tax=Metarhizium acridum (strain CQMa 102) TaxID=655827 RepID=E9DQZ3_METAQ|nr:uncharacterized protein MAC_00162 [Metarhizium acridum CQMa 102]EFY93671.1 hypothetical protein MAC_00162 [Metarhizium acridum CQMa 102]
MIAEATKMGLVTTPYRFNADDAIAMTQTGADTLVAYMELTTSGKIGARTAKTLEACVDEIQEIRDAAVAIREDVIVLCHGGPIARPRMRSTFSKA